MSDFFDTDAITQLGLLAPDRDLAFFRRRQRLPAIAVVTVAKPKPTVSESPDLVAGEFRCTWPGCTHAPSKTAGHLANHRFAAHGIRSTNEESIARQARRDRRRAASKAAAVPEYIDVVRIRADIEQRFPINLAPTTRQGALDPGDREHVRRRLCHLVTIELARELKRTPAELAVTIAQLVASGLAPQGLNARVLDPRDALSPAPKHTKRGTRRGDK